LNTEEIKRPISEEKKTFWHGFHGWTRILFISSEIEYPISEDRRPRERLGYAGWGSQKSRSVRSGQVNWRAKGDLEFARVISSTKLSQLDFGDVVELVEL